MFRSLMWLAWVGLVLGLVPGCVRLETTQLRVRDPLEVRVLAQDSWAPLAPGDGAVSVARGRFAQWFSLRPYDVVIDRESGGGLAVRCDACGAAAWAPNRAAFVLAERSLGSFGQRAPWGFGIAVPAGALAAWGACASFAPTREGVQRSP